MPTKTRSELGKLSRNKGVKYERELAKYLREHGFPEAVRAVRTATTHSHGASPDPGDIAGTAGLIWQMKAVAESEMWRVSGWMAETEQQRAAAHADYGILVVKRNGHADPGDWWVYLMAADMMRLCGAAPVVAEPFLFTVRLTLLDLMPLLIKSGYGGE